MYLFGYAGSLEICCKLGSACGKPKKLEVVAPNLAKLHYSWLGDRSFGQQPPGPSVFLLHPCPAPTSMLTHRLLDQHLEKAGHAACTTIARIGAKPGKGESFLKVVLSTQRSFWRPKKKWKLLFNCLCLFKIKVFMRYFPETIQFTHLKYNSMVCRIIIGLCDHHHHQF